MSDWIAVYGPDQHVEVIAGPSDGKHGKVLAPRFDLAADRPSRSDLLYDVQLADGTVTTVAHEHLKPWPERAL